MLLLGCQSSECLTRPVVGFPVVCDSDVTFPGFSLVYRLKLQVIIIKKRNNHKPSNITFRKRHQLQKMEEIVKDTIKLEIFASSNFGGKS